MAVFWKHHLRDVDFSENALKEVPLGLFQLDVSLTGPLFPIFSFCEEIAPPWSAICMLLLSFWDQKKNKQTNS